MRLLACSLALGVAVAAPVHARPPTAAPAPAPVTEKEKISAAIQAWSAGNWARVRALLEPLVQDDRKLEDPLDEEAALRYLADAILQDPELTAVSQEWATRYLKRLLAAADWRPPADTHSKAFYDLYNALREERDKAAYNECRADRATCDAKLGELEAQHDALQRDHQILRRAYEQQEVEVVEKIARNRAVALVPFGVGHFYNGRKGLGAAFLAGEAVIGGVALGLFIVRASRCDRTAGFKPGSLSCEGDREQTLDIRNAEQGMAIAFLGALALDIVLAQVLFRPYITLKRDRVRRGDLNAGDGDGPRGRPAGKPGPPSSRLRDRDTLRLSPAPAYVPGGGGLGFKLRF